ncbi:MAG: preprotein translocase subunit SecA [Pseudomonadales bacterium]|nr:preprotein translocase subunit SecA [Candidatus Woesebacteria bacterium]MCB9802063.1 preprotein translocase subunit SecA [Pseudomonadales bacterium]
MLKFITNLFDEQKKALSRYDKRVDAINALEKKMQGLTDKQLAAQTKKLQQIIHDERNQGKDEQEILDGILEEAFATVREASVRVLGMRHYDVQLVAGIALHESSVTEQKTGEGKTLTVTAPLYLNALLGKGAHLVTVNDYLAELGAGWMGPLYHFLGLSTSVIVHDHSRLYNPEFDSQERGDERLEHFQETSRGQAYLADITYGTNNEFGFDYLRDNLAQSLDSMVQRTDTPHHYAIVDEADSILIDEARTPLIISAPDTEPTKKYYDYAQMITTLSKDSDFSVDEKAKTATLTDLGVKRIEKSLGVSNLYEEDFDTIHHIESALKATSLFTRDKDYIVKDGEVIIVDEHTGRLMYGRRYSDGLHQSIEAKENVPIQQESRTLASISIQNYFRLYEKLAGMTGTAVTESEEFKQIYDLDVLVIPTNKPVIRDDKQDSIYKTQAGKYSALVRHIEQIHHAGQPILIGTKSIDHNQSIAKLLKRKNIPHQVLNAKNHEKEAFIIAEAGRKGAITVATNIAGRGVDIVLGGAKPEIKDFRKKTTTDTTKPADKKLGKEIGLPPSLNPSNYKLKSYQSALEKWQAQHDEVISLGGLVIVGTERHESRRIDNQLRGRSGRQGDPGSTQFFVSLEDDLMRIFGGEQIARVMDMLKIEEDQAIENSIVTRSIESAQVKVEGFFFDQRKRLVEFDDVMNKQRDIIYKRRRRVLELSSPTAVQTKTDTELESLEDLPATPLREEIMQYVEDEIHSLVSLHAPREFADDEYATIVKEFSKLIPFDDASQRNLVQTIAQHTQAEGIAQELTQIARDMYETRVEDMGEEEMSVVERATLLKSLDEKWMDHLDAIESLRDGIWLRGDKKTVLSEYKKEAFGMFESLIASIESNVAHLIYRAQFTPVHHHTHDHSVMVEQKQDVYGSIAEEVEQSQPNAPAQPVTTDGTITDLAAALQSATTQPKTAPVAKAKIGRNDPCPCGSGLKYKKCGLINAPEHKG